MDTGSVSLHFSKSTYYPPLLPVALDISILAPPICAAITR